MRAACGEIAPLLAARRLGAVEASERKVIEAHVLECADCARLGEEVDACLEEARVCPPAPDGWKEIERRIVKAAAPAISLSCTFCHARLERPEAVYCASCLAPHHSECFREHGRCATAGCAETNLVRAQPARPSRRRWTPLLALAVALPASAALVSLELRPRNAETTRPAPQAPPPSLAAPAPPAPAPIGPSSGKTEGPSVAEPRVIDPDGAQVSTDVRAAMNIVDSASARDGVVFVLDATPGMADEPMAYRAPDGSLQMGSRFDRAKAALTLAVLSLPRDIRFDVVTEAGHRWKSNLRGADDSNKQDVLAWIANHDVDASAGSLSLAITDATKMLGGRGLIVALVGTGAADGTFWQGPEVGGSVVRVRGFTPTEATRRFGKRLAEAASGTYDEELGPVDPRIVLEEPSTDAVALSRNLRIRVRIPLGKPLISSVQVTVGTPGGEETSYDLNRAPDDPSAYTLLVPVPGGDKDMTLDIRARDSFRAVVGRRGFMLKTGRGTKNSIFAPGTPLSAVGGGIRNPRTSGAPVILDASTKGTTLVHFYSAWDDCPEELSMLNSLRSTFGDQGLSIIGVGSVATKDYATWDRFLTEHRATWTNVPDPADTIARSWGIERTVTGSQGTTFTLYLVKDGKIVLGHCRRPDWREVNSLADDLISGTLRKMFPGRR
jgi:hypothetical protein